MSLDSAAKVPEIDPVSAYVTNQRAREIKAKLASNPPVLCIVGRSNALIWGLTSEERLRRTIKDFGITEIRRSEEPLPEQGVVLLVRADYAVEDRLIKSMIGRDPGFIMAIKGENGLIGTAAYVQAGDAKRAAELLAAPHFSIEEAGGIAVLDPIAIGSCYNRKLRKREVPYVLLINDGSIEAIENRIFAGAYKGITDFVTKYAWPLPARWVTRQAVRFGWSPNQVTMASLVLVLATLWLFAEGYFLTGILVGWLMTFLDTVDGKLARVTLTSTSWGNIFDHGIDLIHPPFWYAAWWYGLGTLAPSDVAPYLDLALWIVVVGYIVGRLEEGLFIKLFGIQMHTWRPIDSVFRLITARRNPNMAILMLFALLGQPALGFVMIAVWTMISLAFHAIRIVQALTVQRDGKLRSYLTEPLESQPS